HSKVDSPWVPSTHIWLLKRVLLRHPSVQTTCSGSYWCTVVCTLVRLCKEVPPQQDSGQHENLHVFCADSKGEVCSVETAMWDFSGQILEAGVWTKLQIFQPGMCTVPGRLPTTERGERQRKRGDREREIEKERNRQREGEKGGRKSNRGKERENKGEEGSSRRKKKCLWR
uniref:Uncharacterized protein n=1 Tax=Lates calcarifer TaxID=8187 RepID=A0A4W6CX07_LATCA